MPYTWESRKGILDATVADIKAFCLPFKTVLDVGCGTGLLVRALKEAGYDANGIDVSSWAIENADPVVANQVFEADACAIPFKDKKFDLVVSMDTLEHIPVEQSSKALQECMRVSSREVMFRMPCARECEWLSDPHGEALAKETGDESHVTVLPDSHWKWEIQRAGWLLVCQVNAFDLCLLPRMRHFVARRPEYQLNSRSAENHKKKKEE